MTHFSVSGARKSFLKVKTIHMRYLGASPRPEVSNAPTRVVIRHIDRLICQKIKKIDFSARIFEILPRFEGNSEGLPGLKGSQNIFRGLKNYILCI